LTLPSKKIIILGCACVLALGGVVYAKVQPGGSLVSPAFDIKIIQSTSTPSSLYLLQSKIQNAPSASLPMTLEEPSLTTAISQDFIANYTKLDANDPENYTAKAQLIGNLAQQYATSTKITLSSNDISTFSDSDTIKVQAFGNATIKAIFSYYKILKTSPIDILSEAEKAQTTETVGTKLLPIAKAYRSLALDLQKIPAPSSFSPYYLDIINGYLALGDDIEYMSVYHSDPLKSFIGLNNYQNDLFAQADLLKNFPIYFKANGILFSNDEGGAMWLNLE